MEQTVKKRKQQAIETKQKIFDATMELIKEKGIENVQIEDISRRANISMGLFYNYFTNKSDVITEAIYKNVNIYYEEVKHLYLGSLRGEERLIMFTFYVADYHANRLKKLELQHSYVTLLSRPNWGLAITNDNRALYSVLTECVEEMVEDGILEKEISIERTTRNLIALIRGTFFEYLLNDETFDLVGILDHIVKTYIAGLKQISAADI